MSKDFRIIKSTTGKPLSFSCENYSYATNIEKGYPHGKASKVRGSVLEKPLMESNGYSLWLEHIIEKDTERELYWLMWYSPDGTPTIPMSSVFSKKDLETMIGRLARFPP